MLAVVTTFIAVVPAVASAEPPSAPLSLLGSRTGSQAGALGTPGDRIQYSTGRSRDLTGDGWPDVIARQPGIEGGALWAYTHSKNAPPLGVFAAKTLIGKGWNVHNWIGVGELTGDTPEYETTAEAPADILARRASDGALMIYPHSGTFNGTTTFLPPVVVGLGWNKFEALLLGDINTDGFDDIWAVDNDAATSYVYFHSGRFNGTATFRSAVVMAVPAGTSPSSGTS